MRSLEGCKAEVFRRSKKRIARRRAMIGCVPVVCALVLALAWPRPVEVPDGTVPEQETVAEVWMGYQSLDICQGGTVRTVTDSEKIQRLHGSVALHFMKFEYMDGAPPKENDGAMDYGTEDGGEGILLVFRTGDGREARFRLVGDKLTKLSTGESVLLSQEQRTALLDKMEDAI